MPSITDICLRVFDEIRNSIKVIIEGSTSVGDGTKAVATAGTAVQLSVTSVPCKRVLIQAHENNQGAIVVGGENVVAAVDGRRGVALFSSQEESFNVCNLNLLWIDAVVPGDKVHYFYEA